MVWMYHGEDILAKKQTEPPLSGMPRATGTILHAINQLRIHGFMQPVRSHHGLPLVQTPTAKNRGVTI
jgi:hypothetical protein